MREGEVMVSSLNLTLTVKGEEGQGKRKGVSTSGIDKERKANLEERGGGWRYEVQVRYKVYIYILSMNHISLKKCTPMCSAHHQLYRMHFGQYNSCMGREELRVCVGREEGACGSMIVGTMVTFSVNQW